MTTEGTPEPTLRYFNRYVESQNGQITKYYWAGDRLIASRDRAFAALSEIPPGFVPTAEPPQLPQLPPIAVAGIVALVAILLVGPGRRPVRVRVAVAPARALGVGVVFLVSAWPTRAAACAPDPSPPPARHYHLDHLGSIQVITNETGVVQRQIRYRAYGEIRVFFDGAGATTVKTENTRRTFTGYEFELESELHYAGARYYDPLLGQFLTHDPARQFPSPYAYGPGDPFNGTDPTGAEFFGSGGEGGGFTPIGDPFFNELGIPLPQFLFFMPQPPLAEETYTSVDAVVDPLDQFDNLVYRGRTGAGAPSAVAAQSTAGAAAQGAASPDAISGESPTTYFEALTDATDLGPRLGLYAGATFKIYGFGVTVDLDIASYNVDLVDRHDSKFTSGTEVSVDLLGLPLGFELFRREVEVGQVASPLRDLFSQPSHSGFLTPWDALGSGRDASGDFGRFDLKVGGLVGGNAGFDIRGFATDAIDIFRERRGR